MFKLILDICLTIGALVIDRKDRWRERREQNVDRREK
jgi:hypothetical protein